MNPFRRFLRRFRKPVASPRPACPRRSGVAAAKISHRYAEPLDWLAGIQMEDWAYPMIGSDRIGSNDHGHGLSAHSTPITPARKKVTYLTRSVSEEEPQILADASGWYEPACESSLPG